MSSLKLKTLSMKNFLSVGAQPQIINFEGKKGLTLVLGENIDVGTAGSRNGVGKSSILQALTFALFGNSLNSIKKDNLVNKVNNKNMSVVIDFEKDGKFYRIERTRKPNTIKYYVNDSKVDSPDNDESQGESKWTQVEIEKVLGFSQELFKHIVILSGEVHPFLSLPAKGQRDLIEELLGITQLSNKAEQLKELVKVTKDNIREEEIRIRILIENNEKNQKIINDLQFKSSMWDKERTLKIGKIEKALSELEHVNIDEEIKMHENISLWVDLKKQIETYNRELSHIERQIVDSNTSLERTLKDLSKVEEHNCPTCGQNVHDEKFDKIETDLRVKENSLNDKINELAKSYEEIADILEPLQKEFNKLGNKPEPYYETLNEAYNHRTTVDTLLSNLTRERDMKNPYDEQIVSLSETGIQEIKYDTMNELSKLKDHQDFLIKLLTSKDSFVRKRIIDQNLLYLNHRLSHYLEKLNLPHDVRFLNDLSTEITLLGKDYDYDNLSTGEKLRVNLSLSFSFRDVWENMNHHLNLMILDELLDKGLDQSGIVDSYSLLNSFSRDRGKDVFLITHREELISKATNIFKVIKENGFTRFEMDEN